MIESALLKLLCSMGGSVAIQVAAKKALSSLSGLVVVDVVEVSFSTGNLHKYSYLFISD